MPAKINIRNMPDELHAKLKARAAKAGLSLSAYALRELEKSASTLTLEEMCERLSKYPGFEDGADISAMIREERDSR